MFPRLFAILALLACAGCSGAQVLNAITRGTEGVTVERDRAYGDLSRQRYDLYRPAGGAESPVVVFFYGGGWDSGRRSDFAFVGRALASRGFAVAIPDYRVYPEALFPAFVRDGALAVATIRREVAAGRPVALVGHSAGAHIAALLALDPRYLAARGLSACTAVSGFVGLSGPYDFLPLEDDLYRRIFPADVRPDSQPVNFVAGANPPVLLLHGTGDDVVEARDSTILAQALREGGARARTRLYEGVGHGELLGTFAPPLRFRASALEDATIFLRETAGQAGC